MILKARITLRLKKFLITLLLIIIVMVVISLTCQVSWAKTWVSLEKMIVIYSIVSKVNLLILWLRKSMLLWSKKIRNIVTNF